MYQRMCIKTMCELHYLIHLITFHLTSIARKKRRIFFYCFLFDMKLQEKIALSMGSAMCHFEVDHWGVGSWGLTAWVLRNKTWYCFLRLALVQLGKEYVSCLNKTKSSGEYNSRGLKIGLTSRCTFFVKSAIVSHQSLSSSLRTNIAQPNQLPFG